LVSFAAIAVGFAAFAISLWASMPTPNFLMGIPLALAGWIGGIAASELWALATAKEIRTSHHTFRGEVTISSGDGERDAPGYGIKVTLTVEVVPQDAVPARIVLAAAVAEVTAGVVLYLAGQVNLFGAVALCLTGIPLIRRYRQELRRLRRYR
jgi:hypothetical protein